MPDQAQKQQSETAALTLEQFKGVNTATTRPGVPDEMMYWCDGFMPLALRNLRTLYGVGSAIYAPGIGKTVVCFFFYNLGATSYMASFNSDGSVVQINTATGATTTIMAAGTIQAPSITSLGITQYGSQYLIIVANQTNGYWVWDGSILYGAGTLAPGVTITSNGSGYQTIPTVTATGGSGFGAVFTASIGGGLLTGITIVNPGHNYVAGDSVTLVISGGTLSGSGATVSASLSHVPGGSGGSLSGVFVFTSTIGGNDLYSLASISILNGGTGYSSLLTAGFNATPSGSFWRTQGGSSPGIAVAEGGGSITSASTGAGNTYSTPHAANAFPTISISDTGFYAVASVSVASVGSNYSASTKITATGGGSPQAQATFTPNIVSGSIASVNITSPGVYGSNTPPTLTVSDTAAVATATVTLMPFGIQGTCAETYQGHVWVFNGTVFNFSAPGSVSNFATSAGGGSDQTNNSYLKVGYTQVVSTNGFLFLIGDSSMDYISGVVTSTPQGGNPTTTFTQNNSDPEVGTPYPAAVTTLGQEILVANSVGIFVSSGGTFQKKSEALDGVWNTVANFNGLQLSAAKATIFSKRVWMVLATIIDPVANTQQNKLLMYNGQEWWASLQDVTLTFINGQEINSVYTAWGTDGNSIYPLFNTASTGFTKLVQSKLWDDPGGYESIKADSRFWSMWNCNDTTSTNINLKIDAVGIDSSGNQFANSQPYTIAGPTGTGFFMSPPEAIGNQGILTGMTISVTAKDMTLISAKIGAEDVGYRG